MAGERAVQGQLVGLAEQLGRLVAVVEVDDPPPGVDDHDGAEARVAVLGDLGEQLRPAVVLGQDLDDKFRGDVGSAEGNPALRHRGEAVEREIGAADGVGVPPGDDAGVNAHSRWPRSPESTMPPMARTRLRRPRRAAGRAVVTPRSRRGPASRDTPGRVGFRTPRR